MKAIIEMPMGTRNKWEMKEGKLEIDRVIKIPVPVNYGYIPGTLAEDGDPVDVFVIANEEFAPGDKTQIEIIGIFEATDQGVGDNKFLAKETRTNLSPEEVLSHMCRIGHYLLNYKTGFVIENYRSLSSGEAEQILEKYKK